MKAYKVVLPENGKLRSCIMRRRNAIRTYVPGKETYTPKWLANRGYYLCVFRTLVQARHFAIDGERIWLASVRGILRKLPPMLCMQYVPFQQTKDSWPEGTIMVKSVKLIEEVH